MPYSPTVEAIAHRLDELETYDEEAYAELLMFLRAVLDLDDAR